MWTYRNESASGTFDQNHRVSFQTPSPVHVSETGDRPRSAARRPITAIGKTSCSARVVRPGKRPSIFVTGAAIYLIGVFLGALWRPGTDHWLWEYAQNYTKNQIMRHLECQLSVIFGAQFLALLTQLILAALAGFCVFGVALLPCLILLKGVGFGFFASCLYLEYGLAKGAGMELLLFFLPQLLGLFLLLSQSAAAWRLSRELLAVCSRNRGVHSPAESKRVLARLLLCCSVALIPCALSCVCAVLFSGLFQV